MKLLDPNTHEHMCGHAPYLDLYMCANTSSTCIHMYMALYLYMHIHNFDPIKHTYYTYTQAVVCHALYMHVFVL